MGSYVAAIERALDDPDGWRGFRGYLETAFEMQAADCAFTDVLTMSFPDVPEFTREQRRAGSLLPELVERARTTGRLRPDFVHQDVTLLLLATAGVAKATRHTAPDAWRRVASDVLAGGGGGMYSKLPTRSTASERSPIAAGSKLVFHIRSRCRAPASSSAISVF
ncbi:hypothetical protein AABM26_04995 [Curtobacterium aetherium]|uniref:hypothetical protein n=1 Tax=Curtobacterium aetherium TaxID=2841594 RepID=UPI003B52CF12